MKKNTSRSVTMKAPAVERKPSVKNAAGVSHRLDYQAVVGLDVGDRQTHYCVLDLGGELTVEGVVATKEASLRVQFAGKGPDADRAGGRSTFTMDQPATGSVGPPGHCGESAEPAHDFPE